MEKSMWMDAHEVLLRLILEKLADPNVIEWFGRLKGAKTLETWTRRLTEIEAVLSDAEEKLQTESRVVLWLDDVTDLAYHVQDILDTCDTKLLEQWIERQQGSTIKSSIWRLTKPNFNFTVYSKIKDITGRLEEITSRRKQFGLRMRGVVSTKPWKMSPTTSQPDGPVIGMDEAKAHIVGKLLSEHYANSFQNFQVVAIVGTAGVGKTVLAKHVFNDHVVAEQLYPRVWVSVSDDFDLLRVTTDILESVTSGDVRGSGDLNSVQEKLRKYLAGKKFFIVLDDVWNTCSYGQWVTLESVLLVGAVGSRIIVTTRDAKIAYMMGDCKPHNLETMSEDDCWQIFVNHARLDNNRPLQDVELLKEKVVVKCNGLPLAARALGGLLSCETVDTWEEILEHNMWSLLDRIPDILPSLKLSYYYLPSCLKACFTYCAILPNGYEFGKKQLILLWMAEGLIPHQQNSMEDLGLYYFQELVSRSLFQQSSKGNSRYIMPNLVTDLARWAAGSSCCRLEDMHKAGSSQSLPKVRLSSYIRGEYDGVKKLNIYSQAIHLRTFLPLSDPRSSNGYLAHKVTSDLLPKLQYLRQLSLNGYEITELPNTIGELKHLRYLDLSHTRIRSLPDSTTSLCNLQTLILHRCTELKELPTSMKNLINLRHLINSDTFSLVEMPPQLGQLTNLRTLTKCVIGKGSGSGVREIGSLLHLQGTLHLSRLENVIYEDDARCANLKSKERLEALLLEWSSSSVSAENTTRVLDMLHPHSRLKELTIKGYAGLNFSTWIGDPSFSMMRSVRLEGCNHCQFLPPFGQLPYLKELYIQEMDAVESVGLEFYGEGSMQFQALETLEIRNLKNWRKWSPCQQNEGVRVFSCLKLLSISYCPKLEGNLPEKLNSLAKLEIHACEELVVSISDYKNLHESNIRNCKMVVYHTSKVHFDLLKSLCFSNISELRFQTEAFMKSLRTVKDMKITGCEELTCAFQDEDGLLQHLISLNRLCIDNCVLLDKLGKEAEQLLSCKLECLTIRNCGGLLKVPEGLHHLTSLQELHINDCSNLVSFPDAGLPPCLKVIKIGHCDSLLYLAKYQIPPSLRIIEIWSCKKLKSLTEKEVELVDGPCSSYCLEYLQIWGCPLLSLLCKGQFPSALKLLHIQDCGQLEFITERFLDDTCQLEEIFISECPNLRSLPEGLNYLTKLQTLSLLHCQSLVSLPRMSVWPGKMEIRFCEQLEMANLLRDIMQATNLQKLTIDYYEGLSTTYSFPPNLKSLAIYKIKNCTALMESQELQRLTSLTELRIYGKDDPGLVSFPPAGEKEKEKEMLLPTSLVTLEIGFFPNLKKLSKGFQFLTSLETLQIYDCPKLTTLPEKEGLPLSLKRLGIYGCSPLLEEKCKGPYRPKLAHIPWVQMDNH